MRQGASNYMQWHLILSGSDTFLIWTFSQVVNLHLWLLHIRVKQAQRTACRRAPGASCFSARDANSHIVNRYYMWSKDPHGAQVRR